MALPNHIGRNRRKREQAALNPFNLISQPSSSRQAIGINSILIDPITSSIYHIEARPGEAGRCVIVDTRKEKDIFGPGWNARSRVEEYGGGAAIAYGGVVYFSSFTDLRVYSADVSSEKGAEPVAVTPGTPLVFRGFDFLRC